MADRERRIQRIAVGLATLAVLVAVIAVVVVATRRAETRSAPAIASHRVPVAALARLSPDTVKHTGSGLHVVDDALGGSLGIGRDDALVAISGRRVARMSDLRAVLHDLGAFHPSSLFVELIRDREPVLVRWELDGDLAPAQLSDASARGGAATASPAPAPAPSSSPAPAGPDPLIATVRRVGTTTYQLPRATLDAWLADPSRITAGIASAQRLTRPGAGPAPQPDGFQIIAVQPGSVVAALGIQDGDVIRGINGIELASIDQIPPLLARAARISVDVRRQGQSIILNYLIR